jgi:hypothetical protein
VQQLLRLLQLKCDGRKPADAVQAAAGEGCTGNVSRAGEALCQAKGQQLREHEGALGQNKALVGPDLFEGRVWEAGNKIVLH